METTVPTPKPGDELGTILSILRCACGWSQQELERRCGLRSSAVSDYERGHMVPKEKTLIRLVATMGYPLAALNYTRRYLLTLRDGSYIPAPVHLHDRRASLPVGPDDGDNHT